MPRATAARAAVAVATPATVLGKRSRDDTPTKPQTRRALRSTQILEDETVDQENVPPQEEQADESPLPSPPTKRRAFADRERAVKIFEQFQHKKEDFEPTPATVQLVTPTTPRHYDALKTTPRHRIQVAARLPLTPTTPRTPVAGSGTLYNAARQLFARSATPGQLVGREAECEEVKNFLQQGITTKSGRCLYISGPPGTGKSAFVSSMCAELKGQDGVKTAYVNCMSIKNTKDICSKLAEDLYEGQQTAQQETVAGLKELFFPKKKQSTIYVVTLDEIDHLLTFDLEILYTLFEWALNPKSRLVLVGIANALDLTDRFLPRLKSRNLRPQLLQFTPYTVPAIVSVITSRLKSLSSDPDHVPFVHPAAIQFCAKKVASQTGDLRKAFDLMRRLIDVIEQETKAKHAALQSAGSPLSENPNLSSPNVTPSRRGKDGGSDALSHLTPTTAPRATVAHAARIAASAFNHGTTQRLKTLNVQQRAALCALVALEKRHAAAARATMGPFRTPTKPKTPTVRALHELYGQLCRREGTLAPLERGEFGEVVGSLEVLGLVREAQVPKALKKVGMPLKEDRGVVSAVSEKELDGALEGPVGGLLRGLLNGDE